MLSIRCISHSQRTAASCALLRTGDTAFVLFHYHYHKNAILMILVLTASGSDFTSSSSIRRFDRNNSPLLLFGQCKNRPPTEAASSSELFLTGTTSQRKWHLQSQWGNFGPSSRPIIKCSPCFSTDTYARTWPKLK